MKYRIIFLLVIMFVISDISYSQRWRRESTLDMGIFAGGSNYRGELVNFKFFEPRGTHFAAGLVTRYNIGQRYTFKLAATRGSLSGDDNWYADKEENRLRNLHFKSILWDFNGGVDINLRLLDRRQKRGFVPYFTTGISVFKFNPTAQFFYNVNSPHNNGTNGYTTLASRHEEWVNLQPLSTEGQKTAEYNDLKRYSLTQLAVPIGLGVKTYMNTRWMITLEYAVRKTFTDYIDDVSGKYAENFYIESQYGPIASAMADPGDVLHEAGTLRGNPKNKDWYSIFGISLTYRVIQNKVKCFQFR
ncbi:MAG: hypothetical protein IT243_01315 [Bacteroidia bacterium]|nr:hypothetical protein [Bacteroidia bacterium]